MASFHSLSSLHAAIATLWFLRVAIAIGPDGQQCGPEDDGAICGLNTCCSAGGYCGTTSDYCDTANGCQSAYGSCTLPTVPSCSSTSATNGRRVGYYQATTASGRPCENIAPCQLNTTGLTYLIYAFVSFDSSSFTIIANNTDLYTEFTALKTDSMQTWVSVGGGSFSAATWSSMASSSISRATFISSLQSFMEQYAFQGVDIDWEFPNADGSDAQNLVQLVQEMNAAFGTTYGISVTLPADWGSVSGFDPTGMESYVTFFNYMAYDIHGWAIDSGLAQTTIKYPAAITDIATDLMALWANSTDPSRLNLGIPYYGRGYALADTTCDTTGCTASAPSEGGPCTKDTTGIMTLYEIYQVIGSDGATVTLNETVMQKSATWNSDQWMGYDDEDTVSLKAAWADGKCIGGLMFWSIDMDSGAGSS